MPLFKKYKWKKLNIFVSCISDDIVEDFVNDDGVDILGTRKRAKMSKSCMRNMIDWKLQSFRWQILSFIAMQLCLSPEEYCLDKGTLQVESLKLIVST